MRAHDLMSREVHACHPDTPLAEVVRRMHEWDTGFLPVTDPQSGRIRGVVTDRDACMAACDENQRMSEIPASAAMTVATHCCRENDDLSSVHELMRERRIRRLPVMNKEDELVGVISLNDLALDAMTRGGANETREVANTLAEICRHRVITSA